MKALKSHRLFIGFALTGVFILCVLTYLTQRPLILNDNARETLQKVYHNNRNLTIVNFVTYFILLFISNIMYIRERYWDTFIWAGLIFSTFTLIDWWWLGEKIFHYKKSNDLWMGEFSLGPLMGIILAIFGLTIAIGNYMLLKRLIKEKDLQPLEKKDVVFDDLKRDFEK
jgi:hypothetical protein